MSHAEYHWDGGPVDIPDHFHAVGDVCGHGLLAEDVVAEHSKVGHSLGMEMVLRLEVRGKPGEGYMCTLRARR